MVLLSACARPPAAPRFLPLSVEEALPSDNDRTGVNRDPICIPL